MAVIKAGQQADHIRLTAIREKKVLSVKTQLGGKQNVTLHSCETIFILDECSHCWVVRLFGKDQLIRFFFN